MPGSVALVSQASRWPTSPLLIRTIGGHHGALRLPIRPVFEHQFGRSRTS
jgi:hypothetical protein